MINLPASQLNLKYTKQELENSKASTIYKKYTEALTTAKSRKEYYLTAKKAGHETTQYWKDQVLKYWELSQKYLAEYNEFEKNREYPNR